jgi:hypothetical protein
MTTTYKIGDVEVKVKSKRKFSAAVAQNKQAAIEQQATPPKPQVAEEKKQAKKPKQPQKKDYPPYCFLAPAKAAYQNVTKALEAGRFLFVLHQAKVILEPSQISKVAQGKNNGNLLVVAETMDDEAVFAEQVAYWKAKHGIDLEQATDRRVFLCHHFSSVVTMCFQRTTVVFSCNVRVKPYLFPAAVIEPASLEDLKRLANACRTVYAPLPEGLTKKQKALINAAKHTKSLSLLLVECNSAKLDQQLIDVKTA